MVNILVLGGTGATGQALIKEAIARKHTVVVFARSPEKLPQELKSHPSVIIVAGTLEDEEAIKTAFTAHRSTDLGTPGELQVQQESTLENLNSTRIHIDAIISALGPPVKKIHPSGHPIAKGYERIVRIGKEYGVSRFIVLGTASIPDSEDRFDTRFKALVLAVEVFAPHAYEDIVEIGKLFETLEDVDWTIARVPVLIQPKEGNYYAGYIGDGTTNTWLPRPQFAHFVLDEVETPKWIRKRPFISIVNQ